MPNSATIRVALVIDKTGSVRVLRDIGNESRETGRRGSKAFDEMDRSARSFTSSARLSAQTLVKMGAGIVGVLGLAKAWSLAREKGAEYLALANTQEDAEIRLAAVIRATGGAAGYTLDQLKAMASGFQELTRTGDETTLAGMAILATFKQVRGEAFQRGTMAALDMAAVMGQDLNSAILQIGKALNDPAVGLTALSRAGVTFTEGQKETIKALQESGRMMEAQAMILRELESEFGGAAAAAAGSFAGQVTQAKNALGDAKEEMGYVITKNQFFIEVAGMARDQFALWGQETQRNRGYLMALARDGVMGLVSSLKTGIETLRFFHNGWLGIRLAGTLAVEGLAMAMDALNPLMRRLMAPLDALFQGLVDIGALEVNPFDSLAQGLGIFRASSAEVRAQVTADIQEVNQRYDAWGRAIQAAEEKMRRVPAAVADIAAAESQAHGQRREQIQEESALAAKNRAWLAEQSAKARAEAIRAEEQARADQWEREIKAENEKMAQEKKIFQEFQEAYKSATMTATEFELDQLQQRYEAYAKVIDDKEKLDQWYAAQAKKITEQQTSDWKNAFAGWGRDFSRTLNDMLWESEISFESIAESFGRMITQMVLQKKAVEPLMQFADWGLGQIGNLFASAFTTSSAYHTGGRVGDGKAPRLVAASVFDNAPRYHMGKNPLGSLKPNEEAAILEDTEYVLTRNRAKALARALTEPAVAVAAGGVDIEIIDQRGAGAPDLDISESQGPDGRTRIRMLIREEMRTAFNDGAMDRTVQANYGLRRRGFGR